ncbi:MAG: LytTR family DNA-binding domain-containing protein [Acidobacteria bacterium]|nr:LytTR family DNA-binding domain-containing protein [Acidobacteriota bacterium]
MRALIVDDEQPARLRLRQLLGELGVEVVGEAEDGPQAIERIAAAAPDVVLLDIQMPGCSGLDVAASLPEPRPPLVFCTAFDRHAVDAFELNAVDYVLKPVSRARLEQAIARVRVADAGATSAALTRLSAIAREYPTRFLGRRGQRFHVVPQQDVLYFALDGGLTRVHVRAGHYWMEPSLSDLEARVDPARFYRVSRNAIVNLDAVAEVVPQEGGPAEAVLSDGTRLPVSRRRVAGLLERLAGA